MSLEGIGTLKQSEKMVENYNANPDKIHSSAAKNNFSYNLVIL